MSNNPSTPLHPLLATAAVSVIALSGVGIAHMTGVLPGSSPEPAPVVATAPPPAAPAPAPALPPAPATPATAVTPATGTTTTTTVTTSTASPEPTIPVVKKEAQVVHEEPHKKVVHKKVVHHEPEVTIQREAYTPPPSPPPVCYSCGTVVAVNPVVTKAEPSGIGAVGGAILGGVLGHQFGGGHGKQAMTAAGVIGGAMAGNAIEKSQRTVSGYQVTVQMEDGSSRSFEFKGSPNYHNGEHIRVEGDQLVHAY